MSDAKLRELERRWKESGAVEDEAAYLLERVRVGDLTRERLELAVSATDYRLGRHVGSRVGSENAGFSVLGGEPAISPEATSNWNPSASGHSSP